MQENLFFDIKNCTKCNLHKTRNHVVLGSGNIEAHVIIIGEAPGKIEDKNGIPFTGRSGKLLDQILKINGLNKEKDIFLTNIVKCKPYKNNTPRKHEINACKTWLEKEIELIKPKLIIILGKTACNSLIDNKLTLKEARRKCHYYKDLPCFITYHPVAALRNSLIKDLIKSDFQFIRNQIISNKLNK